MRDIYLATLERRTLEHLASGDLESANQSTPFGIDPYFVGPECLQTWRRRSVQLRDDPQSAFWLTRMIVDIELAVATGRAGFHGPPDSRGVLEVGYAVAPTYRRLGYAHAALGKLIEMARAHRGVYTIRASISPLNLPSQAVVKKYGFIATGEQWDDFDGLEIVFEIVIRQIQSISGHHSGPRCT